MNFQDTDNAKVVIINQNEGFLAKSLMNKLSEAGMTSAFSKPVIKEIEKVSGEAALIILFMSEDLAQVPEVLVYIKDIIQDRDIGLILIGDKEQYQIVSKSIPQQIVAEWFERPLDIEKLIKKSISYLDENTGDKRKKTILIIDDDITYMRNVYEWLKERYHVGMATNAVQAISYLAKNRADLILLDYEMPIANGPQVLSMLKNDSDTSTIPVMFLTGHGDKESVLSVVGLSPVDYLLKTIDKKTLLEKLENFFGTGHR